MKGAAKRKVHGSIPVMDEYRSSACGRLLAFHDASYKQDALSFNVAREDINHF